MKEIIGVIAVLMTFVGYIPYIRDILKGKTKPHIYSWFIWALVTAIAFALQVSDNAGIGSFVTLSAAIICFIIFLFGLRIGDKDITKSDTFLLVLSLLALVVWLVIKQPLLSVILVSIVDLLGFVPTIRKAYNKPYTETLSSYIINTVRFAMGIYALEKYTIITSLYPFVWLFANGLFSILLMIRRKQIGK